MCKDKIAKICIAFIFLVMLAVGLCVVDDYGISVDEPIQRQHGVISYNAVNERLFGRTPKAFEQIAQEMPLDSYEHKYYGVAMQLPLVFAEDVHYHFSGDEMPSRTIYLMRHLYTFLVYYFALICFYFLLKHLFCNRWLAITGVLLVFLFGRFFAQSFYNIKDMLFASLMMIALCCAERVFATNRKPVWCLLFALSSALLVTSRIVGALVIVFVLAAMLAQDVLTAWRAKKAGAVAEQRRGWKRALPYILICCAYPIWILITPAAWSDPIRFSLEYVRQFANYDTWTGCITFWGKLLWITESVRPPRMFLIVWMAMTIPIVNQLLCLGGIVAFLCGALFRKKANGLPCASMTILWIMLVMIAGTLGYQFIRQPVIYDDWRHAFYLYPMMMTFAIYGLRWTWTRIRVQKRFWLRAGIGCILVCSLAYNALRIVSNHPGQYALSNIAGRQYAVDFDRDYWELSYYDLTKRLLENTDGQEIRLAQSAGWPVIRVRSAFSAQDARRIVATYPDEAEYLLENFWNLPGVSEVHIQGFEEIDSIWVDGIKISALFRRIS